MQLYVDMDGVLADFDRGYREMIGPFIGKDANDVDWKRVRQIQGFYASLPPMPDFHEFWSALEPHNPIILTGVPHGIAEAIENKREWAVRHIGPHARMIGCKSREKYLHGKRGDVLIDDWEKYRHLWLGMGGHWITHISAENSISLLSEHLATLKGAQ